MAVSFNRNNALNQLEFDFRRARAESIAEGSRGVVSFDASGTQDSFGLDMMPYSDPAVADSTLFVVNLPNAVSITTTDPIIFNSRGYLVDSNGAVDTGVVTLTFSDGSSCVGTMFSSGQLEFACSS